ncbi:MAG: VWA domain-containing protein [Acidipropionibacterium sp.]|nr:VWA domain-containing protein [Acidipropionibacterium sp.]
MNGVLTVLVLGLPQVKDPARLWALLAIPALLALYLLALRHRSRTGIRFTNTGVLGAVVRSQSQWKRHVAVAMALCSLAAVSFAWARPMGIEKVPRERATIVVAIDNSLSMSATDVEPNRLAAAKTQATTFIDSLPAGFNVAVVTVSANPRVVMPASTDRATTKRAIDAIETEDGTAIGNAITVSLQAIKQAPAGGSKEPVPAAIVLLSDGGNTDGSDPMNAANAAAAAKVPVYTIAFGTQTGYVDVDGARERVAPDTKLLSQIAERTRAKSWTAESAGDLKDVYQDVHRSVGYEEVKKEVTARWAFYALGFAIVAGLGVVSMATRWP